MTSCTKSYDVVIYGATAAGVMAAIAAAKEGSRVALFEPSTWFGGLVTGGLSATDIFKAKGRSAVVSAANEFYALCAEELRLTQQQFWRAQYNVPPSVASYVLRRMMAKWNIDVALETPLSSVVVADAKIVSADFNGRQVLAKAWIDSTYEGDLLAAAGCSFSLGREPTTLYGESLAGATWPTIKQYPANVDPYVVPGDPGSGLLPNLFTDAPPVAGAASPYVMAPNYRLTVTRANNRIPFPEPDAYDPLEYEVLGRTAAALGSAYTLPLTLVALSGVVAGATTSATKYDANNGGLFSTDYVHPDSTAYITADTAWRGAFRERVKQYTLGLHKFVRTDTRIPTAVRNNMASIGLCPDEFQATGGFTPQLYTREGRRLVGDFVLEQADIIAQNAHSADAVAFTYYTIDSHPCWRGVVDGKVKIEGIIESGNTAYYGAWLPFRVLLPKATECTNLLVTCAVSVSRVVYCSLRMEPIFMALGHAAGAAAAIAATTGTTMQSLPFSKVLPRVNLRGTENIGSGAIIDTSGAYAQGTVTLSGNWAVLSGAGGIGPTVRTSTEVGATLTFRPNLRVAGLYRVFLKWSDTDANSSNVPVSIKHASGTAVIGLNQKLDGAGGDWFCIGAFVFDAGLPSANSVVLGTDGAGGQTFISAVKFLPA